MQLNREDRLRIKDMEMLRRALMEAHVSAKKALLFSQLAQDKKITKLFEAQNIVVYKSYEELQREHHRLSLEGTNQ